MEIRNLLTFAKVAEAQSLSRAARELGYAQSTVTMQMQQLEQELGVSIYERVGKQIRITQEGQELLTYAIPIIRMSREALRIGKGAPGETRGLLRLGVAEALIHEGLSRRLRRYGERYPGVELEVRRAADSGELVAMLLKNEIDLMVTLDGRLGEPALVCGRERPENVSFVAAPGHSLAGKADVTREELTGENLIRIGQGAVYEKALDGWLRQAEEKRIGDVQPKPAGEGQEKEEGAGVRLRWITAGCMELAVRLALDGAGILLAPDCVVDEYRKDGRLVTLRCAPPQVELWEQTLYHRNKWLTGAMNGWLSIQEDTK